MLIDRVPGLYDPESVRGWKLLKAAGTFVVLLIVLIGRLFHRPKPADDLVKTGVQVEGRVYEVQSPQNGPERMTYGFAANGSTIVARERRVSDLDGVERLGTIRVWYNPADPNDCVTPNELRVRSGGSRWVGVGFLLAVLGLDALYIGSLLIRKSGTLL